MGWRDDFQSASFRGVPFRVQEHDTQGGRRVASHEFPERDLPYTEDLGRKQRSYSIQGVTLGTDYFTQRDDLIKALEQPGAGLLVHPWLGRLQVVVTGYTVVESTAQGGLAKFTIQCVESGLLPAPTSTMDAAAQVAEAAQNLLRVGVDVFAAGVSIAGAKPSVLDRLKAALAAPGRWVAGATAEVDQVNAAINRYVTLARNSRQLAQQLVDDVANVVATADSASQALRRLFHEPVRWPLAPYRDKARQMADANQYHLDVLTNLAAIAAAATLSTTRDLPDRASAAALMEQFSAVFDSMQATADPAQQPLDDALWRGLADLRRTVMVDIADRSLLLPQLLSFQLSLTTPALVLAHRFYDDLAREADLVERNRQRWPGFMPAGIALERLSS